MTLIVKNYSGMKANLRFYMDRGTVEIELRKPYETSVQLGAGETSAIFKISKGEIALVELLLPGVSTDPAVAQ